MATHDLIVIGASAGGVEALTYLAGQLPPDLPAAIVVVVHLASTSPGLLPRILSRAGPLPAVEAADGALIMLGQIYVAPPARHLVVHDGRMRLGIGPRINHHRPAIDPLFRSAARAYGPRVVGVVLTGYLDDGTAGLAAIKRAGGVAVVQDPADALIGSMPASALQNVEVDHVVPLSEMAALLVRLANEPAASREGDYLLSDEQNMIENGARFVAEDMAGYERGDEGNGRSVWTCPECGGVLWELRNGDVAEYRCHAGHSYSPAALVAEQGEALEAALWSAVRALEERAALARRLAGRLLKRGSDSLAVRFAEQADEAERHANEIRGVIESQVAAAADLAAEEE